MRKYNKLFYCLYALSIMVTILHLVFMLISNTMSVGIESLLLNAIPYGLPILVFSSCWRHCREAQPRWTRKGFWMAALFILTFLAMNAHVTLAFFFSKDAFINTYFNVPILYLVPLLIFWMLWLAMKGRKVKKQKTKVGKFFDKLPLVCLVVMLIHCGIVSGMEIYRQMNRPLATSAPWWVSPLLVSLVYVVVIGLALLIKGIYHRVKAKR